MAITSQEAATPNRQVEKAWPVYPTTYAKIGAEVATALTQAGLARVNFSFESVPMTLPEGLDPIVTRRMATYPLTVSTNITAESEVDYETWSKTVNYVCERMLRAGVAGDIIKDEDERARIDAKRAKFVAQAVQRVQVLKSQGKAAPFDPEAPITEGEKIDAQIADINRNANVFRGQAAAINSQMVPLQRMMSEIQSRLAPLDRQIEILREIKASFPQE